MNYNSDIKELHQKVAYFYRNFPNENFLRHSNNIKELINQYKDLISKKDSIFRIISLFEENFDYIKIIKEVITGDDSFFNNLNNWLMNQGIPHLYYESIAYFTARIMRCLDSYNSSNQYGKEITLFRGLRLDYNSVLLYEKSKGKIILIPPFTSCSLSIKIAEIFARRGNPFKDKKFSVIFVIKFNHKENWISNGIDIRPISKFPSEQEIIIQAFSFFYVKEVKINNKEFIAYIYLDTIGKKEILEKELENGKDIEYNSIENIMQIKK